jgi:hypothetical protein
MKSQVQPKMQTVQYDDKTQNNNNILYSTDQNYMISHARHCGILP